MSVHAHVHVCMMIRNKFACKSSYFLKLMSVARKDKSVDNCTSQFLLALIPPHSTWVSESAQIIKYCVTKHFQESIDSCGTDV